jgi:Sulfotransferase domain
LVVYLYDGDGPDPVVSMIRLDGHPGERPLEYGVTLWRRGMALSDVLPNLVIVGVPKAGTGSLFSYLRQHPDICPSTEKEVGFFSPLLTPNGVLPDLEWYSKYFAHCRGERYRLEATPNYCLGGDRLIQAIKRTLDNPRIIVSLRDPVDRLWSAYTFQRSLGHLHGVQSFEQYLSVCEEQRRQGHNIIVKGHFNGVSIGFYGDYLQGWFDAFGDDIKVIFMDDLSRCPDVVVMDVCRWLGIDGQVAASFDYASRNKTAHPRSVLVSKAIFGVKERSDRLLKPPPAVRAALRKAYTRLNAGKLEERLQPSARLRVEELYRESNLALVSMLRARGHDHLPSWLCET